VLFRDPDCTPVRAEAVGAFAKREIEKIKTKKAIKTLLVFLIIFFIIFNIRINLNMADILLIILLIIFYHVIALTAKYLFLKLVALNSLCFATFFDTKKPQDE
jgi:hypothetical protein